MTGPGPRGRARQVLAALALVLAAGCGGDAQSDEPGTTDLAAQGERLYQARGCASCHSVDGSQRVGPTWKGLYGSVVELETGEVVTADEQYLAESIADPDGKTVKGFPRGVMAAAVKPGSVPDDDIRALVAYIRSLR